MLSLTRNVDESIMLYTCDGPIEVIIRRVNGLQVQVGIIAPFQVKYCSKKNRYQSEPALQG